MPFIGIGMADPNNIGSVVPVSTWLVTPGTVYNFKPSATWYCARGKADVGNIVDPKDFPITGQADFATVKTKKTVEYTDANTFEAAT